MTPMEMDAFLESQQSKVWKIIVNRDTNGEETEELYNGVCIRIDGLILTHAFHIDNSTSISIYCPRYGSSRAEVHICDNRSGLCLLNATQQNDYDYLEFGNDTVFSIGQVLYGIRYTEVGTNPIIQMGYVAYDYNPDSESVTPLTPAVRTAESIDRFYLGEPSVYNESVSFIQTGHMKVTNDGRGCPAFDASGNFVGIVAFNRNQYDLVIHVNEIKEFVRHNEKKKRKRKKKTLE